jgi:lysozyme
MWERLETHSYVDAGGALTIGIGHPLTSQERNSGEIVIKGAVFNYRNGLTEQQCWDLLDQDLQRAENLVNAHVKVALNQNQFIALVSFVLNVGADAFIKSTLLRVLNEGHYEQVPAQLAQCKGIHRHVATWFSKPPQQEEDRPME